MCGDSEADLIMQASQGDDRARQELLQRHRSRLKRMVTLRMDVRLAARIDPSDVVQEALAEAAQQLSEYIRTEPIAFYPWLRRLAWERLVKLHEFHLTARKRSVDREEHWQLPDASVLQLAKRLLARSSSPSQQILKKELRERVRRALANLVERDRELLLLRYMEQLSTREIADILGLREGTVKVRHLRALRRLREQLGDDLAEDCL